MTRKATTYWDYIKVEEITSLQGGLEESDAGLSNDEVLFITVHQIDELWLKLALRELVSVRGLFAQERVPEQSLASAVRGLRRMALLFHHIAQHFALMETMTTRDYLAFRDKLSPASGFQSAQLREIEILMGLRDSERIALGHEHGYMQALRAPDGTESAASRRVAARLTDRPTLREALDEWLFRTPIQGSTPDRAGDAETVRRFVEQYLEAHAGEVRRAQELAMHDALTPHDVERLRARYEKEVAGARAFLEASDVPEDERARRARVRAALVFIEGYRELPLLAWPREVIDAIVAIEQAFVIFRQRHARMVERVIGRRTGTGGSAGVDYLDQTALRYRIFHDVWAVRTLLIRAQALPPVETPEAYALGVGQ
ncbi:tryptophan 2,3-dioxygenase family protein [Sandaracinus amylolyticus]|uniref:tryptophan 2,3-dioxygenase family protein n=1 Tax=Sandaracinus amylolyticus TaxID=927083 RepID=UPI003AF39634